MSADHREQLKSIRTFPSLVRYLRDEMGWPIDGDDFEDMTFEYTAEELGIDAANAAKIQEIKRLRPLSASQPWGIFFVKFEPKRLPVVALRRILGRVVLRKRASASSAERAAWAAEDLLFVSNFGEGDERQITFAHFSVNGDKDDLSTLRVLGWDNQDTALYLDHVAETLTERLVWPENDRDIDRWRDTWRSAFTLGHREAVTTSKALAVRLAALARDIRDRIGAALAIETKRGELTKLMKAFQAALIDDLGPADFADMYAQTIAYGLLSARIADPHKKTADDFAGHMRTNPFLRELMETFLKTGGRRGKAGGPGIDFDELGVSDVIELLDNANIEAVVRDFGDRNPEEDPVIHFYELFLKEYDAKKRVDRGVFYTPRPVVSFIVRSVDEALRSQFGLDDGLADTATWGAMAKRHSSLSIPQGVSPDQDFVTILDPAVGTGTFLVEVIDLIHRTLVGKWKSQGHGESKISALWNAYVPTHLLTRLHGFELLMAPYAIAHLKIGLKLYETGYRFGSDERARVYLTNALEPERDFSGSLAFVVPVLAHEAEEVNRIKATTAFTVVVGNPPYLREKERGRGQRTERIGGWVRFGDPASGAPPLFDDFISPLADTNRGVHAKLAYELSVMFWRLVLWYALERRSHLGVVGMISPRAYISGPGHAGMRKWLRAHATEFWVTDLGGDNRGARTSENVFEIETGVAIGICIKAPRATGDQRCRIYYAEISGTAEQKLAALLRAKRASSMEWRECASEADEFLPASTGQYSEWPKLTDLFPWQHSGSQFKRLWPIAESPNVLEERWRRLVSLPRASRAAAFVETRDRIAATGPNAKRFTGIESVPRDAPVPKLVRYCYRALDRQWAMADERLADFIRPSLVGTLGARQVFAATLMSKQLGKGPAISVSECLPDMDVFCNRGAKDIIPLWRDAAASQPNTPAGLLNAVSSNLGVPVTPQELFCYCIAILGGPTYTSLFERELAAPGPRIPLTADPHTFRRGALLGAEFVWLQTYGERWLLAAEAAPHKRLSGSARIAKAISQEAERYPVDFEFDATSGTLRVGDGAISAVSAQVYGYSQSGFQPVKSWLRYRMKERGGRARHEDTRSELDKIRPVRWAFTQELLELLWAVEGCVRLWPSLDSILTIVLQGKHLPSSTLPTPTLAERAEPERRSAQQELGLA
jgi:hypothetical protein